MFTPGSTAAAHQKFVTFKICIQFFWTPTYLEVTTVSSGGIKVIAVQFLSKILWESISIF